MVGYMTYTEVTIFSFGVIYAVGLSFMWLAILAGAYRNLHNLQ